jgi:excisionase family DNA binding protein
MVAARSRRSFQAEQCKRQYTNSRLDGSIDPPTKRDLPAGFDARNRLLTVAQAAEICQLSKRQLHRLIHDGRIPVLRFGRAIRIRPTDLGL